VFLENKKSNILLLFLMVFPFLSLGNPVNQGSVFLSLAAGDNLERYPNNVNFIIGFIPFPALQVPGLQLLS
jgi:hypothetical protein